MLRDLKDDWKTEVGPMRIPHHHRFTHSLIRQFRLETSPFLNDKADNHYFIRGKKVMQGSAANINLKFYK
jgi:monoamine oxidase